MEHVLEEIRDQQKATWNKFSPGWKKWDDLVMDFLKPVGDEMIRQLELKGKELVLDIAAGTGEPGLSIAALIPQGKVIVTDLAEDMLEVAKENAAKRGIKNFETKACDVSELPFPHHTFDSLSCRFGFMFFPDMLMAAKEMARVLKPGGKVTAAVWGVPEKNFWITAMMSPINKHMQLPPPSPGTPGIFRCAKSGMMTDLFQQAGLKNMSETEVNGTLNCGTIDVYWNWMTEVVAPVVAALSKADSATKEKIKNEVYRSLQQKYPDGNIRIDSSATIIYGEKLA